MAGALEVPIVGGRELESPYIYTAAKSQAIVQAVGGITVGEELSLSKHIFQIGRDLYKWTQHNQIQSKLEMERNKQALLCYAFNLNYTPLYGSVVCLALLIEYLRLDCQPKERKMQFVKNSCLKACSALVGEIIDI